ncbi:MAG: DUF4037 domain-containing protein [Candidatus Aenigmatarchaeota archaeon]
MTKFIPGLKLSEIFYKEAVKPILDTDFPRLKYSTARIDRGSDVLGFDTPQSMDHDWGPRLLLFLSETDYKKYSKKIDETLRIKLPHTIRGFPTSFGKPDEKGIRVLENIDRELVYHNVIIYTIRSFFEEYLGINPYENISVMDWLTFPQQKLSTITSGKVFHDDLDLNRIRQKFAYYPRDVWLYILAAQWTRISQEEPFIGRCGDIGDELGSKIIASRLVRDIMKLCFLMEKKYHPYMKWFGASFSKLSCSRKLLPIFNKVLSAKDWKEREKYLSLAYETVAKIHNNLKITKPMPTKVSRFHERPYLIIHADTFASEIKKAIKDREIKRIKSDIGALDQFTDSTDVADNPAIVKKLRDVLEEII